MAHRHWKTNSTQTQGNRKVLCAVLLLLPFLSGGCASVRLHNCVDRLSALREGNQIPPERRTNSQAATSSPASKDGSRQLTEMADQPKTSSPESSGAFPLSLAMECDPRSPESARSPGSSNCHNSPVSGTPQSTVHVQWQLSLPD